VQAASFVTGFSAVGAGLLLAAACAFLALRVCGIAVPPPAPAWAAALAIPIAAGFVAVRRGRLPATAELAHLDRRLGLEGLLLSASEARPGGWDAALHARVVEAAHRIPRVRWAPAARRLVLPAVLFCGVFLLPAPEPAPAPGSRVVAQAIEDLRDAIDLARQEGVLDERRLEDLAQRVEELRERAAAGEEVAWADVDALGERLEEQRALQRDALARTAHALQALREAARTPGETSGAGDVPDAEAAMQNLLQQAAAAGLLDALPAGLDPSRAAKAGDAETMEQVAEALGKAALEQAEALAAAAGDVDERALQALREALGEAMPGAGKPAPGEDVGRGGVDRGPGHARLAFDEHFDGDTSTLQTQKLPPGRVLAEDWEIMQVRRVDPTAAPQRNEAPGSTAGAGSGEAAWRRRLSPSHRAVVHEFFSSRRAAAGNPGGGTRR